MRVVIPVPITPLKLISSTAADVHAPAAYAGGTTYAFGAIASVAADYSIYESLANDNLGNTPATSPLWWRRLGATETPYNVNTTYGLRATASNSQRVYESLVAPNTGNPLPVWPEKQNTWWKDVGPTNKAAMFDDLTNTKTVSAGPLTVVFKPGVRVNSIGLTGMDASSATITVTSVFGGGTVYGPVVVDLVVRPVKDMYEWAFKPFETLPSVAYFNLPPFSDAIITVTLTRTTGNVKCGSVMVGNWEFLGEVELGASSDEMNFSLIERDDYSEISTLTQRPSVPKINCTLSLPSQYVNRARKARRELNAVPALFVGVDDNSSHWFDTLIMSGVYRKFEIHAPQKKQATINLEVEEI